MYFDSAWDTSAPMTFAYYTPNFQQVPNGAATDQSTSLWKQILGAIPPITLGNGTVIGTPTWSGGSLTPMAQNCPAGYQPSYNGCVPAVGTAQASTTPAVAGVPWWAWAIGGLVLVKILREK